MKLRATALILALAASSLAWGEALDPPQRLARLSYVEGEVTFQGAQTPATSSLPDRPLIAGDHLITENGGRAELAFGTATIRLDQDSELSVVDLDETTVRVELAAGSASVYLRELRDDETFEIVTPNATIALNEPGEYRVDVNADDASVLTVREGAAEVATVGGPVHVAAGQRVQLEGRDALARLQTPPGADAFDDWILEREVRLAEAEPPRYTPYEDNHYEELDRYGQWYDEPRYGRVWMPAYGYSGWSPYRGGYWQRAGFGWSWFDPAPWGFFTYYSGRWTYLGHRHRWCWVPGPRHHPESFAENDTRPFGRPRRDARERPVRESAPRTADRRSDDGNASEPVEMTRSAPHRGDVDRRSPRPRENAADEGPRSGTNARGGDRERGSSPPAAAPPQGGGTTMQPSRTERPRSEATPERGQNRREIGTPQEP